MPSRIEAEVRETLRVKELRELDLLVKATLGSIIKTASPHALESGPIIKHEYLDFDLAVRDPAQAQEVAEVYARVVAKVRRERTVHNLAFLKKNDVTSSNTIGALSLAGMIASHRDVWLPYVIVRLDKDILHDRIKMTAALRGYADTLAGRNFAVITDHISRGGEIMETVRTIEAYGGKVSDIVAFTCRLDLFSSSLQVQRELQDRGVLVHYWAEARIDESGETGKEVKLVVNARVRDWLVSTSPCR